jgi:DNA anti-recombination protein RmuC
MFIAVLSALHTFLKYDTLEDRHHQYSRHFGNLQVDLETMLSQSEEARGSAAAQLEKFKTKYSVLTNNCPDLPLFLEQQQQHQRHTRGGVEIEMT